MKKILLLMMCWPTILSAQPGVKITGLAVEAGTVTLDVRWEPLDPPTVWSDTVWVFVDYNDNGTMKRLPLSEGATLTATSAPDVGRVEQLAGNYKGVRVIGNARSAGSFSATVKLLTATANVAGACVYASNYPPVGEYVTASSITFTGTPPFDLELSTGTESVQQGYELQGGQTLTSFTDKTGAPGIIKCVPPTVYTLTASASGFCADDAAGVTFSLNNTQTGVKYQLYRDGATAVGTVLIGTGSTLPFSGSFKVAGVYTAKSVAESGYCATAMTGSHNVVAYSAITAGTIESGSMTTDAVTNPNVTIGSDTDASGGSGSYTYLWLRTGTSSPATLTTDDNVTAYTITSSDCPGAGTYYFNRYAKDKACVTAVWVAAYGTYTLTVPPPPGVNQPQGSCTFTQPAVVGTFASFDKNYSASTYVTLTDERDFNNYTVVKIDGRWWMAQNLNYQGVEGTSSSLTWQANATSPSTVSGSDTTLIGHFWCPGTSGATFSNRASCDVWGALYSWETAMMVDGKWSDDSRSTTTWVEPAYSSYSNAANTNNGGRGASNRGICPPNWHVPTDGEWGDMLNAMESTGIANHHSGPQEYRGAVACPSLRASCLCPTTTPCTTEENNLWVKPSQDPGTDDYCFRLLPSGHRYYGGYGQIGAIAYMLSSSASRTDRAWAREFRNYEHVVRKTMADRTRGLGVRCIMD